MTRSVVYVGDQQPSFPAVILLPDGVTPMDLTGYLTVVFAFWMLYDTANKFKLAGVFVNPRTAGTVRYDLGATDLTGLTPGLYGGAWTLGDANSKPQHVPAGEFIVKRAH